jgi:hypothetical protein
MRRADERSLRDIKRNKPPACTAEQKKLIIS